MSDKKKKELTPEELESAAGGRGELNEGTPTRRRPGETDSGGTTTSSRGVGGTGSGELEMEQMGGMAAGRGELNEGGATRRTDSSDPTTSARGGGGGTQASGELDIETMGGLAGGRGRTGTEAGGMEGRETGDSTHSRTREEEESDVTRRRTPGRSDPLPPV
jgi:hypothetical protein